MNKNYSRNFAIVVVIMLTIIAAALYPPTTKLNKLELKVDSILIVNAKKDSIIEKSLLIIQKKDSIHRAHMKECTFFSNKTIEIDKNRYIRLKSGYLLITNNF